MAFFQIFNLPPPLTTAPRENPGFIRELERYFLKNSRTILRDSAYPRNVMPKNFWGKAVPHP